MVESDAAHDDLQLVLDGTKELLISDLDVSTLMDAGTPYTFTLSVANFLSPDRAQAAIVITKGSVPAASLEIIGGQSMARQRSKPLQLQARVTPSLCADEVNNVNGPSLELLLWQEEEGDVIVAWAEIIGDGYSSLHIETDLADLATGDGLLIPKYSMGLPGSVHRVAASIENAGGQTTATFVDIEVEPGDLIAIISGGSEQQHSANKDLVLDASGSIDEDLETEPFAYSWSCSDGAIDVSAGAATLTVPSSSLTAGTTLTFSVTVSQLTRTSTASVAVTLIEGEALAVTIKAKKPRTKYPPNGKLRLRGGPKRADSYLWSLDSGDVNMEEWESYFSTTQTSRNLVARRNALTPGEEYVFRLIAEDEGISGFSTMKVVMNAPPSGGELVVSPLVGEAGTTAFTLLATGFGDDPDDYPLEYGFSLDKGQGEVTWLTRRFSAANEITTVLPEGLPEFEMEMTITAHVRDVHGAESAVAQQTVRVIRVSGGDAVAQLAESFDSIGDGQVTDASLVTALALAGGLGSIDAPTSATDEAAASDLVDSLNELALRSVEAQDSLGDEAVQSSARLLTQLSVAAGKRNPAALTSVLGTLTLTVDKTAAGDEEEGLSEESMSALMETVDSVASQESAEEDVLAQCRGAAAAIMGKMSLGLEAGESAGVVLANVQAGALADTPDRLGSVEVSAGSSSMVLPADLGEQVRRHRRLRQLVEEEEDVVGVQVTHMGVQPNEAAQSGVVSAQLVVSGTEMHSFTSPLGLKIPLVSGGLEMGSAACSYLDDAGNWSIKGMILEGAGPEAVRCSSWHLTDFSIMTRSLEVINGPQSTNGKLSLALRFKSDPILALGVLLGTLGLGFALYCVMCFKEYKSGAGKSRRERMREQYARHGTIKHRVRNMDTITAKGTGKRWEKLKDILLVLWYEHTWVCALFNPDGGLLPHASQEQILLLVAQVLTLMAAQAIFYGTTPTSLQQSIAIMLASTMIALPATFIFPWLLKLANTPPDSSTLKKGWLADRVSQPEEEEGETSWKERWSSLPPWKRKWIMLNLLVSAAELLSVVLALQGMVASVASYLQLLWGAVSASSSLGLLISIHVVIKFLTEDLHAGHSNLAYFRGLLQLRNGKTVAQALLCGYTWISNLGGPSLALLVIAVAEGIVVLGVEEYLVVGLEAVNQAQQRKIVRKNKTSSWDLRKIIIVQSVIRRLLALKMQQRRQEYRYWEQHCVAARKGMKAVLLFFLLLFSVAGAFITVAYLASFDTKTSYAWALTVSSALMLDIMVKQPVKLTVQHYAALAVSVSVAKTQAQGENILSHTFSSVKQRKEAADEPNRAGKGNAAGVVVAKARGQGNAAELRMAVVQGQQKPADMACISTAGGQGNDAELNMAADPGKGTAANESLQGYGRGSQEGAEGDSRASSSDGDREGWKKSRKAEKGERKGWDRRNRRGEGREQGRSHERGTMRERVSRRERSTRRVAASEDR
ncbi:unnamed protein product [Chrysoparadoxa australica]